MSPYIVTDLSSIERVPENLIILIVCHMKLLLFDSDFAVMEYKRGML